MSAFTQFGKWNIGTSQSIAVDTLVVGISWQKAIDSQTIFFTPLRQSFRLKEQRAMCRLRPGVFGERSIDTMTDECTIEVRQTKAARQLVPLCTSEFGSVSGKSVAATLRNIADDSALAEASIREPVRKPEPLSDS